MVMFKVYWDCDGVFVPDILKSKRYNIDLSKLPQKDFAEYIKSYNNINPNIIQIFQILNGLHANYLIENILVSGRKKSLLGDFTIKLLKDAGLYRYFSRFEFYPEDLSYDIDVYFLWKLNFFKIESECYSSITRVLIVDDSKTLLDLIDGLLKSNQICLKYAKLLYLECFEDLSIQSKWIRPIWSV